MKNIHEDIHEEYSLYYSFKRCNINCLCMTVSWFEIHCVYNAIWMLLIGDLWYPRWTQFEIQKYGKTRQLTNLPEISSSRTFQLGYIHTNTTMRINQLAFIYHSQQASQQIRQQINTLSVQLDRFISHKFFFLLQSLSLFHSFTPVCSPLSFSWLAARFSEIVQA